MSEWTFRACTWPARMLTTTRIAVMKRALYDDPITHKFALIKRPDKCAEDDAMPILPTDRWFGTREEALSALPELLNRDE